MPIPSIFEALSILIALVAVWRTRASRRRFEQLSESYWEQRYETGQLKARVNRLEIEEGLREPEPGPQEAKPAAKTTFVPLSSLKK